MSARRPAVPGVAQPHLAAGRGGQPGAPARDRARLLAARCDNGEIELLLTHPTGSSRCTSAADPAKDRAAHRRRDAQPAAKEYNAGTRMYGLVNGDLLWAMDMAAVGQPMQTHASAQLKRVG